MPADGLPNGLALDERTGTSYATDSVLGTIMTVPLRGGTVVVWSSAPGTDAPAGSRSASRPRRHRRLPVLR
ncbi:hypothetical protein ACRAKI_10045 [Saccharothrix isguenensis]